MKPETISTLYNVQDKLNECRKILDEYMYRSGGIPEKDHGYCREVYDSICKTLDLI